MDEDQLLNQQIEYYRARASEYDEWILRTGRYDRGEAHRKQWFLELEQVREALQTEHPGGDVLELACGTGIWTRHLVSRSSHILAVDAASEAIHICRDRIADQRVEFVCADLFSWKPKSEYDLVFFGFWLSHVPMSRFNEFWKMVRDALKDGGKVFFVDSLFIQESTATDHDTLSKSGRSRRKLNDGREFEIVKIFHDPSDLERVLNEQGWRGKITSTTNYFYYGLFYRQD